MEQVVGLYCIEDEREVCNELSGCESDDGC